MKIYVLTITETQKSFSPMEVKTFVSHEQAHKTMIQTLHDKLAEIGCNIPIEELDNPNGYENGGLAVGYDYARDDESMVILEIFESELSLRETIIGNLIAQIQETYKVPSRFHDVLYRLINEYSDKDLYGIASENDFINDRIIGEALYENALQELGGKDGEYYYGKILEYLNESDQFVNVRCTNFEFWDMPIEEEKLKNWQRWFIGMLCICDGNQTMINLVRKDIDDKQPLGDKIFTMERKREIVEEHKDLFPENHRELCSELSDEQYYEVMVNIIEHKYDFGYGEDFYKQMVHIYEEMKYIVHKIIQYRGIDILLKDYGEHIEIRDSEEIGWYIVFNGDPYEIASMVDDLKETYKSLF